MEDVTHYPASAAAVSNNAHALVEHNEWIWGQISNLSPCPCPRGVAPAKTTV